MCYLSSRHISCSIKCPKETLPGVLTRVDFILFCLINLKQVLLRRSSSSSLRTSTSAGLFYGRGVVFSLFNNVTHYSTSSSDDFSPSSKQRSRGPVMAAKKASGGVHFYFLSLLKTFLFLHYKNIFEKKMNFFKLFFIFSY